MGKQELVRGHFNGRVGSIVGSRNIGGDYIKARVFSKSPPSELQTACLTAFGALQRFASGLCAATKATPYIRPKGQSYYNAVCSLFKPSIATHGFVASSLETALKTVDPYALTVESVDIATGTLTVSLDAPSTAIAKSERQILLIVYNQLEKAVTRETVSATDSSVTLVWQPSSFETGWLFAMEIIKNTVENLPLSKNRKAYPYVWRNATVTEIG